MPPATPRPAILLILALLLTLPPGPRPAAASPDPMACAAKHQELLDTVAALVAPGKGILVRRRGGVPRGRARRPLRQGPAARSSGARSGSATPPTPRLPPRPTRRARRRAPAPPRPAQAADESTGTAGKRVSAPVRVRLATRPRRAAAAPRRRRFIARGAATGPARRPPPPAPPPAPAPAARERGAAQHGGQPPRAAGDAVHRKGRGEAHLGRGEARGAAAGQPVGPAGAARAAAAAKVNPPVHNAAVGPRCWSLAPLRCTPARQVPSLKPTATHLGPSRSPSPRPRSCTRRRCSRSPARAAGSWTS
jgi:hypothetical protein